MRSPSLLLLVFSTASATFNIQQTYHLPPPPPPPPPPSPSYYPPASPSLPSYAAPPTFIIAQPQQLSSQSLLSMQSVNTPSQSFQNPPSNPSNFLPILQDGLVKSQSSSFVNPAPVKSQQPSFVNAQQPLINPMNFNLVNSQPSSIMNPQQSFVNAPSYPQSPQYPLPPSYPEPPMFTTPAYIEAPPSRCWRSSEGFPCCNKELESLMFETMNVEGRPGCNMQKAANELQRFAQTRFNYSFESVVAQSEMVNKGRFMGDMMCKVRVRDGRIALLYATPSQYSLESFDYHPLTDEEMQERNWTEQQKQVTSMDEIL
ncbi:ground-like domain protein [Ancylostoma ceylanicum]|uniref:Ground-like domain protein n=1 Tax=Ancylostoma ceylanicum TaxID=53326 RepID=A0A0D6M1P6_9BILA|nr:ground-like domain protein [Ancylostoma ceylanicum]